MEKQIMDFYYKSAKNRRMIDGNLSRTSGLCDWFDRDDSNETHRTLFQLMKPTEADFMALRNRKLSTYTWASGKRFGSNGTYYRFNALRQNIVLFMAAMNGEL